MSYQAKILVTGSSGQVGSELKFIAAHYPDYSFAFKSRAELDISDEKAVIRCFETEKPDYCLNCAAYTAVDRAESDEQQAYLINATAVQYLAKSCQKHQTVLLHLSSDYVYHNRLNRPIRETDKPAPKSVYASSKLTGDRLALAHNQHSIIIRCSWIYSSFGHNFLKTMLRLGKERDKLNIVYDQVGVPAYARDIARLLLEMIAVMEKENRKYRGVYHYAPSGVTCWYDYAKTIFELAGINCEVRPIPTRDYPTPAARPHYSLLNCEKIVKDFKITIPYWRDSVKACLQLLGEKK